VAEPPGRAEARLVVAAAAAVGLLFLSVATCVGSSVPTAWSAAGCAVLAALAGGALVDALRVARPRGVAPGVYLLPFDLVDVSPSTVRVVPLATARDVRVAVDPEHPGIEVVRADGAAYFFAFAEEAHAAGAHAEILAAIARVEQLGDHRDDAVLAPADPFVELRTGEWPISRVESRPRRPRIGRASVVAASIASALLGLVDFHYAARADDDARFATAFALGTVSSYRAYLSSGGGRYSNEVVATLIPRLELRLAILDAPRLADVESLETFIAKYPRSIYADVARAELATKVPGVNVASP
jgi:hypothetical protein